MTHEQALELARWALRLHYGTETITEDPAAWTIDAIRMAGASGQVQGAELVLQLVQAKGMLATLLGLVRELTEFAQNCIDDIDEGAPLAQALVLRAQAFIEQADQLRLNQFVNGVPAKVEG